MLQRPKKEANHGCGDLSNYYAEWIPSDSPDKPGCGRIILCNALWLTDLYYVKNLHSGDFRNLLTLLQTEKPIYWDTNGNCLRTAHPQSRDGR